MKLTDSRGLPVSTQSVAALERYELAARPAGDPDRATYRLLPRRYLLGMRAFSLEVTANYSRAEDFGRHALIAYNAAGCDEHQRRMLAKLEKSADGVHINANITRELGLPLARSIVAMVSGRHAEAVELLLPVRSRMNRISGSHTQRDLVQLTCIEATLRCGNGRLARARRASPPGAIAPERRLGGAGSNFRTCLNGNYVKKETVMFANFIYRGLPTSVLLATAAFVQYFAIRAFV